jgi:hypothetical protein
MMKIDKCYLAWTQCPESIGFRRYLTHAFAYG